MTEGIAARFHVGPTLQSVGGDGALHTLLPPESSMSHLALDIASFQHAPMQTIASCGQENILSSLQRGDRAGSTHTKLAASLMLPVPRHFATLGKGHSGLVRSVTPLLACDAMTFSGGFPCSTH